MALTDLLYSVPSQSAIGAVSLDVLLSEQVSLPSIVSEYQSEQGFVFSDGIIPQARRLSVSGSIATGSMQVFGALQDGTQTGKGNLQDAKVALEAIWAARSPVTIVTGLDVYANYGMTSCDMTRASDGASTWLDIKADFIEITTVSNATTMVAANVAPSVKKLASATKVKAGQVTGGTASPPQVAGANNSILLNLGKSLSSYFQ